MHIKVSDKTLNVPKNFAHSKVGSVGSKEMPSFGIFKIGPLEPCGNVFWFGFPKSKP